MKLHRFVFVVILHDIKIKKHPLIKKGCCYPKDKVAVLKLILNNVDTPLFYIF